MECNCNNNNSNGGVIPWVRGNRLPLIICVYENVVTQEQVGDSTLTVNEMTRVPYTIQDNDTVTVIMKSGFRQVEMPFTTDGNKVMVTDNGELPTGAYTVEVTIERGDGARGRWQETRQVRIYENTSDAQLGEMYSIDADLFFYAKGDTGTGIADITNNPDGTLTITMTDGTSYVTEALKGDKGDKGDTGDRGVSIVSFDVTGQTDVSVIYTVTFSDDTTQDISVPKGPQGDTGLTGNGISSTTLNSDYTLTIAYTDGTTYTTPSIRGAQGAQGVSVIGFTQTGETATNTMYNLVFSDGRTQSVAIPKGVKGDKGDAGNPGPQGVQGPKGDTVTATDYTLYNVQGSSSEGAMSQDATTKAISAQTGYYTCGTAAGTAPKVVAVENGNLYKRTLGGHFKVQMTNKNTAASGVTLQVGSETATTLWYNGAAVSATNTWDAGEVISVYYDGTYYQASNAQGGGGKAEKIKYDNSQSGLASQSVQGALDINSEDINKLKGVVGEDVANEFSLVGNNNTGVSKILHLEAGRQYKLSTSMTAAYYSDSSITNKINVYSLSKVVEGTSTNLFITQKNTDTPPSEYVFTAEEADNYLITIRANSGTTVEFELAGYYESNLLVGKQDYSSVSVNTVEFGYYNYKSGTRIYFGRKKELQSPVRVIISGVPEGVTCILATFENYSDTLNPNATNEVETGGSWGTVDYTFSNPLSNYLKINFKSTAGASAKITTEQVLAIRNNVQVTIISYVKLGGVHGENYDLSIGNGGVTDAILGIEDRLSLLNKNFTLDSFTCSYGRGNGTLEPKRYRCAIAVPGMPIHVKVTGVPDGLYASLKSNYTVSDALSTLINSVEDSGWNILDYTFTTDASVICVNFKKGVDGDTAISQEEVESIQENVRIAIFPWDSAENVSDIIDANDKDKTIRYLRSLTIPEYSQDGEYTAGLIPFTLLHFSDLHSDAINLKRIVQYYEHYSDYIDDAIGTGDLIRNTYGESFDFWSENGADNILISTGNHEYYNGEKSAYYTQISPLQVYNKFLAPYMENWGTVVFPANASTEGYNYYYKDYPSKHVRLIVLDSIANISGTRDGLQATWLANVLEDARTSSPELHVICAIHIGSTMETPFNNSWTSLHTIFNRDGTGAEGSINAPTFAEFYTLRDAVETFINNGGKFVCWIAGHRHCDSVAMLNKNVNNEWIPTDQFSVHIATASSGNAWSIIPKGDDCDRTNGTKQQDCFNIYSVDTERQLLRIFRVGCDVDRNGRHKGSLLYDYANRQVLYYD